MKKADLIIIAVVLAVAGVLCFYLYYVNGDSGKYVEVEKDGKIVDTFPHPNFFAARFRSVYAQIAAAALPTRKALVQLGEWGCFLLWAHCLQAIKAV